ncbi:hypothetical protein DSO57_1033356 [Entomophthora muscae]|uniref:Uncharacterized protein n=1 Tax=Entomophthora muscae TaxID=34485 RepID=A0ACC2T090_9FUNG|nr:hypothetical protein DSO57_1033356 [Entomophthora muscae]
MNFLKIKPWLYVLGALPFKKLKTFIYVFVVPTPYSNLLEFGPAKNSCLDIKIIFLLGLCPGTNLKYHKVPRKFSHATTCVQIFGPHFIPSSVDPLVYLT